ncbi:MAG: hypothetical protein AB7F59_05805 [Bdellovibrionales bacterium]
MADDKKSDPTTENSGSAIQPKVVKKLNLNSITVLFLAADEKPLMQTQNFLKKRGWTPHFCGNIKNAFEDIAIKKPDFVLISWNIPNTNIVKVERMISATFNLPCIVFTEKVLDGNSQSTISGSSIKQFMLAPISGPSLHMKIRKIIKQGEEATKGKETVRTRGKMKSAVEERIEVKCKPEEVPKEGDWEQVGTSDDGDPIWMLKTKKKSIHKDKKGSYVFKGKAPPVMGENGWQIPEGGTLGFTEMAPEALLSTASPEHMEESENRPSVDSVGEDRKEGSTRRTRSSDEEDEPSMDAYSSKDEEEDEGGSARAQSTALPNGFSEEESSESKGPEEESEKNQQFSKSGSEKKPKLNIRTSEEANEETDEEKSARQSSKELSKKEKEERQLTVKKEKEEREIKRKEAGLKRLEEKKAALDARAKEKAEAEALKKQEVEKTRQAEEERQARVAERVLDREKKRREEAEEKEGSEKSRTPSSSEESKQKSTFATGVESSEEDNSKGHAGTISETKEKSSFESNLEAQKKENETPSRQQALSEEGGATLEKERQGGSLEAEEKKKEILKRTMQEKTRAQREQLERLEKEKLEREQVQAAKTQSERAQAEAQEIEAKKKRDLTAAQEMAPATVEVQAQGEAIQATVDPNHADMVAEQGKASDGMLVRNKTKLFGKRADSVFAECVVKALESTIISGVEGEKVIPLKLSQTIDCIPINSTRFKGILIYSSSGETPLGPEFTRSMKNFLLEQMNARGEDLKDEGELTLSIAAFEFVQVASEFAEFLTVTSHAGAEIGMAFIQSEGVFPALKSNEEGMVSVEVQNVDPGEPVGFDAYIHLPLNKKYVKYVKKGGTLEAKRKDNLAEFSYKHFYVKDNEVKELKGHCASAFVQRMVRQFTGMVQPKAS